MSALHALRDRLWRSRIMRGLSLLATPPQGPRRSDATSVPLRYGSGGKVDSMRPGALARLDDSEIEAESSRGLGHRLTWGVSRAALRAPWSLPDGVELPAIAGIDWRDLMVEGTASARAMGGAHLMVVTDDGLDPREPLPPGPHEILAVHVLTARDARPRRYETDVRSPMWTHPATWDVHPIRQEVSTGVSEVHSSRLIYLPGLPTMPSQPSARRGYDLSALDAYWPAIRRVEVALESATIGALELSTPWVRLQAGALAGADGDSVEDRLDLLQQYRSMARLAVLLGDDTMGRDNVTLTGLRTEVIIAAYESVCALEGLSLTAIFGQPPAGLSSVDEAGRRNDARVYDAIRQGGPTAAIRRLVEITTGRTVGVGWAPIDVDDPTQSAALVSSGIADPDELRERHGLPPREVEQVEASEADIARITELMASARTERAADIAEGE